MLATDRLVLQSISLFKSALKRHRRYRYKVSHGLGPAMDLSQFLDVTCDEGEAPLDSLTEDDIVLLDEEPVTGPAVSNGKRPLSFYNGPPAARGPPMKKARRGGPAANGNRRGMGGSTRVNYGHRDLARSLGLKELSAQAVGILKTQNITLKKVTNSADSASIAGPPIRPRPAVVPRPAGSITWKYRQLPENQYTADIREH